MVDESPVDLQTEVDEETYQRMQQKAPGGEVMSKKELTRYWIAQGLKLDAREGARAGLE
jgi:ribosomal protein L19E